MKNIKCPDCDVDLDIPEGVILGEIVSCPSCGLELEVSGLDGNNIQLQELAIEGEDWGE